MAGQYLLKGTLVPASSKPLEHGRHFRSQAQQVGTRGRRLRHLGLALGFPGQAPGFQNKPDQCKQGDHQPADQADQSVAQPCQSGLFALAHFATLTFALRFVRSLFAQACLFGIFQLRDSLVTSLAHNADQPVVNQLDTCCIGLVFYA